MASDVLISESIHPDPQAPVVVVFGGSPVMRDTVIRRMAALDAITAYGTLSEAEGLAKLSALPRVDHIVIGGRYTPAQRERIKTALAAQWPKASTSEPGHDFPYDHERLMEDVLQKITP